jgi:membrane fusion protein, multidrug efflux system
VARIEQLTRYQRVTAPFEGLITVRNAAVGNLITPQSIAAGRELYRLTDITTLRVFANTPQANVGDITVGQRAVVTTQDQPDKQFIGIVKRTANLLDTQTRTLLTEVNVVNQGRALLPGMYAQVKLDVARTGRKAVMIPGDTLVTTSKGPQVATVVQGGVHWVRVEVGRDLGAEVEITQGLTGEEQLVVNPSDDVREGRKVKSSRVK